MPSINTQNKNLQNDFHNLYSRILQNQAVDREKFNIDSTDLLTVLNAILDIQGQILAIREQS